MYRGKALGWDQNDNPTGSLEQKKLYEILVPCNWNDGTPVRTRHHREWDKRVRKIAGGLTVLLPGKGHWVHKSELYVDRMIPVRVFCTAEQMQDIAQITLMHYEQEAVMYYQIADWVLINHATEQQKEKFQRKRNGIAKEVSDAHSTE